MQTSLASNEDWLANDAAAPVGRRAAPRLRLSMPARLVTLTDTRRCILVNVSRTGAQIGLEKPLKKGDGAFLQLAGIDQFGEVVRSAVGLGGGVNGLLFECPLSDTDVIALRHFAESFAENESRQLRAEVQAWVSGAK